MAIVISSMYWLCRSCGRSAMTLPHGPHARRIGWSRIPRRAALLLVGDARQPGVGRERLRDLVEDVRPDVAVGVDAADHVDLGDERVADPLRLALLGDHRVEPPLLDQDRGEPGVEHAETS